MSQTQTKTKDRIERLIAAVGRLIDAGCLREAAEVAHLIDDDLGDAILACLAGLGDDTPRDWLTGHYGDGEALVRCAQEWAACEHVGDDITAWIQLGAFDPECADDLARHFRPCQLEDIWHGDYFVAYAHSAGDLTTEQVVELVERAVSLGDAPAGAVDRAERGQR